MRRNPFIPSPPLCSNPLAPAQILAQRCVATGTQDTAPTIEATCVCDDGTIRTFISRPDGRWRRKRDA